MRPLPPLLLLPIAATLAACALGEGGPVTPLTPYDIDLAQIRDACLSRGGVLLPSGRLTGRAQTETLCLVTRPVASAAR